MLSLLLLTHTALCVALAPQGPWDAFNFAPASKTVRPVSVRAVHGTVQGAEGLVTGSSSKAVFTANNSYVVLDWGKEVGGILSLTIESASPSSQLSLAFSESPQFISPLRSDDSCRTDASQSVDGVQTFPAPLVPGLLTQTVGKQRGGFRFLTIVANGSGALAISNVSLAITFMPHWDDLRAYSGYFFAKDPGFHDTDFLTKLWYAGAYTVQTNTIDSHQARQNCGPEGGWNNDASGGPVTGPILVDGAKRDRNVWPGDCGISSHTELVALNDLLPTRNSLTVMFSTQDPATGALQYSGPPINAHGSDTYISWSLIGTHSYFLYTGDLDFVAGSHVDDTGLANVPAAFANDWGRDNGGGHNSAANALLYRTLVVAADLADHLGDAIGGEYRKNATRIKTAYNALLWDGSAGLFRDNDSPNSIHPQDGNSLAVVFNLTTSAAQNKAISGGLTRFWTPIGPLSPELNDTIIPFVGGLELQAHFIADEGERAIKLMEAEWGYMLYTNFSVQSTLLEGFTKNGSLGYRAAAGYDFDFSYTSHAHGWSTGPTSALTFYLLGIQITSQKGQTWAVAPVLSGLSAAEGGIETVLGAYRVKWTVSGRNLTLVVGTPQGTVGSVTLPGVGPVMVDGVVQAAGSVQLIGGQHTLSRMQS
ncbi:Glycoside hydrolase family 78 protein [Mycena indigotica]|uniref:Glycoside hydrolase family 78 protein n=1 Tax=Mycena indigotica TaxID=2126181 RepID=A0A8H6VU91_9AGAR|nr:Glycoside hydrolase family 78 protein [Mycena indigotica]KAF7292156.1 Glycoside hydrolase family 78 protein [Mycena indigotica]